MRENRSRAISRRRTAAVGLTALAAASTAAAAAAPAAAAAATSATKSHTVDITAVKDSYRVDTHGAVPAGLVKIRFTDHGTVNHQAQLFRLNNGVTFQQWQHDLHSANPNKALIVDAAPAGGTAQVTPHNNQTVWGALQGGTYVIACFVPGPGGVQHIFMGMYASFDVQGRVSQATLDKVHPSGDVDGVIDGHDMTYTMPKVIQDGGLYRFQDTDAMDTHELNFGKLAPGKTVDDAKAWFAATAAAHAPVPMPGAMPTAMPGTAPGHSMPPAGKPGPPPFTFEGGFGAQVPGGGGWFKADVDPGEYIAFCLVPDDKTHIPHAAMGMVVGFTVK